MKLWLLFGFLFGLCLGFIDDTCPPCFNCLLPSFKCQQYTKCNEFNGKCECKAGFTGDDCGIPQCGSLADGSDRLGRVGSTCECNSGWAGINCNVCQTDDSCNPLMPKGVNGTCYSGGLTVKQNHQMCNVTNRKILDQLKDRVPQATLSCNKANATCDFQFWVGSQESFYCTLEDCEFTQTDNGEKVAYECSKLKCSCIPERMLCGESGSIDISDFLTEEIKGPARFECRGSSCLFKEKAMDELIKSVFGDSSITLDCISGECMYYKDVPGYDDPHKGGSKSFLFAYSLSAAVLLLLLLFISFLYFGKAKGNGIKLSGSSSDNRYFDVPLTLSFQSLKYQLDEKTIVKNVNGMARPGEIMAIIGPSGAGKSTLLDLIARRRKRGDVSGNVLVNGQRILRSVFTKMIGFVDQDDTLMPTLTAFENVLMSAMLRLPRSMSNSDKINRAYETMEELNLLGIQNQLVGNNERRGISGGERRRVAIACELVTRPPILFLDEPTTGLDSFNAYNVLQSLVTLAKKYSRTVILTIHQPRSNIVELFDGLLLLSNGETLYSGKLVDCKTYFSGIGYECPSGFSITDYLIDLAAGNISSSSVANSINESFDEESNILSPNSNQIGHRELVDKYSSSQLNQELIESILVLEQNHSKLSDDYLSTFNLETLDFWSQVHILCGRVWKNIYRNPQLLATHYLSALGISIISATLFYNLSFDISGFQNRLGLFFFLLSVFGFSTLTSLSLLADERPILLSERANGYYSPLAYFISKVLFDVIPLRLFPPLVLGTIIYPIVGLVSDFQTFLRFQIILVLFNLTAASICLFIGIAIRSQGVASLTGSLVMLFSLLFAGLLLNKDSMPHHLRWLQKLSIFHYAFEALAVNEVRYLTLVEEKFGLSIDVPGATILSTFGFNSTAYAADALSLSAFFVIFIILSYTVMHFFLREQR